MDNGWALDKPISHELHGMERLLDRFMADYLRAVPGSEAEARAQRQIDSMHTQIQIVLDIYKGMRDAATTAA